MTITLEKGSTSQQRQKKLRELHNSLQKKKQARKKKIIEQTFGSVIFDPNKTALEIQKEMRDEWS